VPASVNLGTSLLVVTGAEVFPVGCLQPAPDLAEQDALALVVFATLDDLPAPAPFVCGSELAIRMSGSVATSAGDSAAMEFLEIATCSFGPLTTLLLAPFAAHAPITAGLT